MDRIEIFRILLTWFTVYYLAMYMYGFVADFWTCVLNHLFR